MSLKLENDRVEVGKPDRCLKDFSTLSMRILLKDDALFASVQQRGEVASTKISTKSCVVPLASLGV